MTTRYLACAVLMEMASGFERMSLKPVVGWTPRATNLEADECAKEVTGRFDPALKVNVVPAELDLPWM